MLVREECDVLICYYKNKLNLKNAIEVKEKHVDVRNAWFLLRALPIGCPAKHDRFFSKCKDAGTFRSLREA